jgi:hypothetical protein
MPETIDLTPAQAADRIRQELGQAAATLRGPVPAAALDGYVRALGLGLQLGPAPTQEVLMAILAAARALAGLRDAETLSALGPALVDLVGQVRDAGALPPTGVMDAWATVAADIATLVGQVGLALSLGPDHRTGMLENARTRARLLDEATGGIFALTSWFDELDPA